MNAAEPIRLFPQEGNLEPSKDYSATINGNPVFVYRARASARAVGEWWPGHQRPLDETEWTAFLYFEIDPDAEVEATVDITYHHDILRWVKVKPERPGNEAEILERGANEGRFRLRIRQPGIYVCEIDTVHYPIYVFAQTPSAAPECAEKGGRLLHYGPGVHQVGRIELKDGDHLHIEGGGVVYGYVEAENAEGIRISGRGILDASPFERNQPAPDAPPHEQRFPRGPYLLHLKGCRDLRVEGIKIVDSPFWTFVLTQCERVHIREVQVIGGWRYNADGIDIVNCSDVRIEDSFIRAYDDCICLKGREETSGYRTGFANCEDVLVRRCVLWNDWGVAIKIGTETMADEMTRLRFEDIDILYYCDQPFAIQCGDFAHIHDVELNDIRIGDAIDYHIGPSFFLLKIYDRDERTRGFIEYYRDGNASKRPETRIENIRFRNIRNDSMALLPIVLSGLGEAHPVRDVSFENVVCSRYPDTKVEDLVQR